MPLYFFDIYDGDDLTKDDQGIHLPGLKQARIEAIRALPEFAREKLPAGDRAEFVSMVRNDSGRTIFVAKLSFEGSYQT